MRCGGERTVPSVRSDLKSKKPLVDKNKKLKTLFWNVNSSRFVAMAGNSYQQSWGFFISVACSWLFRGGRRQGLDGQGGLNSWTVFGGGCTLFNVLSLFCDKRSLALCEAVIFFHVFSKILRLILGVFQTCCCVHHLGPTSGCSLDELLYF